ncbi:MAG: hypothetical protein H6703_10390 [Myxococcales bacterium]|nr:hypothetical protein [Myxococcales bacterium]
MDMMAAHPATQDCAAWLAMGYVQGQRDLLLLQLRHRFDAELPSHIRTRVASATPELIDTWSQRVLDAPDLATVFAD